jgi:hypothetical protein
MVSALNQRNCTPVPASRGDSQVNAADLQRAGVGGAQLDKQHGRVALAPWIMRASTS